MLWMNLHWEQLFLIISFFHCCTFYLSLRLKGSIKWSNDMSAISWGSIDLKVGFTILKDTINCSFSMNLVDRHITRTSYYTSFFHCEFYFIMMLFLSSLTILNLSLVLTICNLDYYFLWWGLRWWSWRLWLFTLYLLLLLLRFLLILRFVMLLLLLLLLWDLLLLLFRLFNLSIGAPLLDLVNRFSSIFWDLLQELIFQVNQIIV